MKKIKEYLLKDRTPFAEGLSFKKMFLIFVIFSFLGCLYEDILFMTKNYINYGILDYSTKRGLLYLELSPIYGWGACIMVYILARKPRQKLDYFLIRNAICLFWYSNRFFLTGFRLSFIWYSLTPVILFAQATDLNSISSLVSRNINLTGIAFSCPFILLIFFYVFFYFYANHY